MRDFSTLYQRVKSGYGWQQVSLSAQDFMDLYEENQRQQKSLNALRLALIASGRSAGAMLSDQVSNEFLGFVPEQVAGTLQALREEVERLKEEWRDSESRFSAMCRVEAILRAQMDFAKQLETATLPCGHLSRYGHTEDGGKNGDCYVCQLDIKNRNAGPQ